MQMQQMLGHTMLSTTMDSYVHSCRREAADKLDGWFADDDQVDDEDGAIGLTVPRLSVSLSERDEPRAGDRVRGSDLPVAVRARRCALGGTRTPNLLIRSEGFDVPDGDGG
jgi:hypothetical protein